jgi:hypothetical protein
MSERWAPIQDFPGYDISDHGEVYSRWSNIRLSLSVNQSGVTKVTLQRENLGPSTRSVALLVAEAFSEGPRSPSDVPIHVDGHQTNNHYENLVWRPRWYAWKYRNQFSHPIPPDYYHPVENRTTRIRYATTMLAGIADGVLWELVYNSSLTGRPVFPTGHIYSII